MTALALTVNFHGTDLFIIEHDGQPYTPMKTIVEGMGLDWSGQLAKLNANSSRWGIRKILIPTLGDMQEAVCLPLRKLFGWLASIHPNKVKPELRETIHFYQNECDDVLWNHWSSNKPQYSLKSLPPSPHISESEAAQFRKSIEAYCKSDSKSYPVLYRKVYEYYGITSYKHIPAGKLYEAALLCGMPLLKLSKPKLPKEPELLTFTHEELESLVANRVKAIEGEVIHKHEARQDAIKISIDGGLRMMTVIFDGLADKMARYLVQVDKTFVSIHPIPQESITMTEKEFAKYMTEERGYIVMKESELLSKIRA